MTEVMRMESRTPRVHGEDSLDNESFRREFLGHCRLLMEYYDDLGYFVDNWPGVNRTVVIRIVIDQDDSVTLEEALDFLLILVTQRMN